MGICVESKLYRGIINGEAKRNSYSMLGVILGYYTCWGLVRNKGIDYRGLFRGYVGIIFPHSLLTTSKFI